MKMPLQTRVSAFITLIIILISSISTYLFITTHKQSKERGMIARGTALSFALSKAAEDGIINEDLDLLKKASAIIMAPDVVMAEVYSNIWEPLDAYPIGKMKDPAHQEAVAHFATNTSQFSVPVSSGRDFYAPILFRPSEDSPDSTVGYARIVLSTAAVQKEIGRIILTNLAVSAGITLFAIISINVLIGRLVINPVMSLYGSVSLFKEGRLPEMNPVLERSADELRELAREFTRVCRSFREKEDRLVESDRRIRSLFERVDHAIFRLDGDGLIIEANRRFRDMFGDAQGLCDILAGYGSVTDCLKKTVMDKELHLEDAAAGNKGRGLVIALSLYPETGPDGAVKGFDGYIIDVTEKKRLEERLIRSQKMEAVGTLAGGMAHDFNNLLTAILGYSEIILSMTKEGDPFNKPATIIYDAAKRGADFGRKILAITRKEKLETKPMDINQVVRSAIELLQRSIPKNIEIVTELNEGIPIIKADASQLQQVIINLAVNARDAMPGGGRLAIETSVVGAETGGSNDLHFRTGTGGFIKLSVADTGVGIDTVTQRKIFDPFFTTKEMGKGTGLGLYIVHSIISNHGGYINLYSEPFKGTQFNIYLPVSSAAEPDEAAEIVNITGSGTLLVIDDESDVRELCRDMLEPLGYTVMVASSGMAGVNIFREMKDAVRLVILDMVMPKMSGTEVFQALRTINPAVKILLCSGYSQNGFAGIDELLRRGAAGFIQKPFSRQNIGIAIKKALSAVPDKGDT
ncbi:MAG: response regulator [Nitrospiraceae bacterium]|nr:response regulator [Nitrospiraceae bacterium]